MSTLRVLTLNIAHGRGLSAYQGFHSKRGIHRNLQRIVHLLEKHAPDIVALQEVDEDSHWNERIHLLDVLKEGAGYSYSYLGVHNRRQGRLPLAYGNGLLSRYPIEHAEHEAFGRASLGAPKRVAVAYIPGLIRRPGFGTATRAVPVRVAGSSVS